MLQHVTAQLCKVTLTWLKWWHWLTSLKISTANLMLCEVNTRVEASGWIWPFCKFLAHAHLQPKGAWRCNEVKQLVANLHYAGTETPGFSLTKPLKQVRFWFYTLKIFKNHDIYRTIHTYSDYSKLSILTSWVWSLPCLVPAARPPNGTEFSWRALQIEPGRWAGTSTWSSCFTVLEESKRANLL